MEGEGGVLNEVYSGTAVSYAELESVFFIYCSALFTWHDPGLSKPAKIDLQNIVHRICQQNYFKLAI